MGIDSNVQLYLPGVALAVVTIQAVKVIRNPNDIQCPSQTTCCVLLPTIFKLHRHGSKQYQMSEERIQATLFGSQSSGNTRPTKCTESSY